MTLYNNKFVIGILILLDLCQRAIVKYLILKIGLMYFKGFTAL